MSPALGAWMPVTRLTNVVLPAPLGPISPRISPRSSRIETSSLATRPPKRLVRPRVSRSLAMLSRLPRPLAEETGRAQQEDEKHEREAIGVLIRRRDEGGTQAFDDAEHEPADERPRDRAEPADHDDLEALDRGDDAVRRKDEEDRGQQGAGEPGECHADAEGELV